MTANNDYPDFITNPRSLLIMNRGVDMVKQKAPGEDFEDLMREARKDPVVAASA